MTPEETRARLLYRDGLMLVLDKPAGVAVHRGPKGGANLEDDFDALRFGLPRKPALAHRLDRDTAGCLVLGRHHKALEKLGLLFKQGRDRQDLLGDRRRRPRDARGPDRSAARPARRDARLVDEGRPAGLPAQTRWRLRGRGRWRGAPIAWLELEPLTGRTHQLRVHCAAEGWPILGDSIYGARADIALQLLARRVEAPLYKNKPAIVVEAPAPAHMRETLAACGFSGDPPREPSLIEE